MKNKKDILDYYTIMLKVQRDSFTNYFHDYLNYLGKSHFIQDKYTESKSMFLEYLIIALEEEMVDVVKKGKFVENIERLTAIWKETFLQLDDKYRFSGMPYWEPIYEKRMREFVTELSPQNIHFIAYQMAAEVMDASTRMVYYIPKPILSVGGIHSIEKMGFMPDLHKNGDRISFHAD